MTQILKFKKIKFQLVIIALLHKGQQQEEIIKELNNKRLNRYFYLLILCDYLGL